MQQRDDSRFNQKLNRFNDVQLDGSVVADGILPAICGVSPQKHVLMSLSGVLFILEDLSLLFV